MIMECTDCSNCANFDFGYRVYCLCQAIEPESIEKYFPVGELDASWCSGFDEGEPVHFSAQELRLCEGEL